MDFHNINRFSHILKKIKKKLNPKKFIDDLVIHENTNSTYDEIKDNNTRSNNASEESIISDITSFLATSTALQWPSIIKNKEFKEIDFIDIGGEFGVQASLFKMLFKNANVSVVEIRKSVDDKIANKIKNIFEKYPSLENLQKSKLHNIYSNAYGFHNIINDYSYKIYKDLSDSKFGNFESPNLILESIFRIEKKYDVIFSFSSMDYFYPTDFCNTLHRILKDDGVAMIWCPTILYLKNCLNLELIHQYSIASRPLSDLLKEQVKIGGNIDGMMKALMWFYKGFGIFTYERLKKIFDDAGFKIIKSSFASSVNNKNNCINHYGNKIEIDKIKVQQTLQMIKKNLKIDITEEELFSPYYYYLIEKK
jgi:hypothetical protein